MSRIGKKPIVVPSGVKINRDGRNLTVEGPKGKLSLAIHPHVEVEQQEGQLVCARQDDQKESKALHGLTRALISNMIEGVTKGFEKKLEIVGVGYNAQVKGKNISLTVGYSRPRELPIPDGVTLALPDATHITVTGTDKQKVGQFAAEIRAVRKPEPYKGTGIKYHDEVVRRKAGKAFGSGG